MKTMFEHPPRAVARIFAATALAALALGGCAGATDTSSDEGSRLASDAGADGSSSAMDPNAEPCDRSACGPVLGMPNRQCADGTFGGPTGRCVRGPEGMCGWEIHECPGPCGAFSGAGCPAERYCAHDDGLCQSTGDVGSCRSIPQACDDDWDPVCGCDGKTYGSRCMAAMAGQSVLYEGECRADDAF